MSSTKENGRLEEIARFSNQGHGQFPWVVGGTEKGSGRDRQSTPLPEIGFRPLRVFLIPIGIKYPTAAIVRTNKKARR